MRKLVLIEIGNNTRITITLVITSINQPMHIKMPSTTVIFVLGGATPTPTPSMTVTPTAKPTTAATPTPTARAGRDRTPAPVPTGRSHPLVTWTADAAGCPGYPGSRPRGRG